MPEQPFLVVPLDARPVCYDQVEDLAQIAGIKVLLPPKNLLGFLKQPAPMELLANWWKAALAQNPTASVILSLDTLAYGGLIASRMNTESVEDLKARLKTFLDVLGPSQRPRYAFSSILRIPNYDNDEEEPEYWSKYGRVLYQFSVETHQQGSMPKYLFDKLPAAVIQDFLDRRQKNFHLNQAYLDLLAQKTIDFLTFCQDDTGPYGFNVKEAEFLKNAIQKQKLQAQAVVQTGADEVASLMLAKALWFNDAKPLRVYPWFFPEHGKKIMARFDGMPIGNVVQRHIQTLGGVICISPKDADLILIVNAPSDQMGDHCTQEVFIRDKVHTQALVDVLREWLPQKSISIADVVYANGGDAASIRACLAERLPLDRLAGYAGWNTPGNSIGTALAMGAITVWAQQHQRLDDVARRKLLLKRLLDDWYYQAEVRIRLRKQFQSLPEERDLNREMQAGVDLLKGVLNLSDLAPTFTFPCQRFFEVSVNL